jgi:NTE family protein
MNKNDITKKRLGLALSGGGYRAAAFHLGVLRKLNTLKILDKIDVISTISGGSIIGAYYVLNRNNFESFEASFKQNLQKSCIKKIVTNWRFLFPVILYIFFGYIIFFDPFNFNFSAWMISILVGLYILLPLIFQFRFISFTSLKIKAYKAIFFGEKTLSDLPSYPIIAINATNLSTGTLWTFSKNKSSDSSYEFPKDGGNSIKFECGEFPIAIAVASSTSVPVPFNPVTIPSKYFKNIEDYSRVKPMLIDGGLYDNQGIHKLSQFNSSYSCDIIIASDGSQPFGKEYKSGNTFSILYRGIDVMMRKIKNLQFIRDVYSSDREIAYFSLDWKYEQCVVEFVKAAKNNLVPKDVLLFHQLNKNDLESPINEIVKVIKDRIGLEDIIKNGLNEKEIDFISKISTNLTALKKNQIDLLSKHGEVLTEIQIKLYCPTIFL